MFKLHWLTYPAILRIALTDISIHISVTVQQKAGFGLATSNSCSSYGRFGDWPGYFPWNLDALLLPIAPDARPIKHLTLALVPAAAVISRLPLQLLPQKSGPQSDRAGLCHTRNLIAAERSAGASCQRRRILEGATLFGRRVRGDLDMHSSIACFRQNQS